jgi:hypothetical protein
MCFLPYQVHLLFLTPLHQIHVYPEIFEIERCT